MYERFTDRARKAMQLANQEAQRFNHATVLPEHILLGICKEGGGLGAHVLNNLDIDIRKIRLMIEKNVRYGDGDAPPGRLPHSESAKATVARAIEEARNLGHNHVGTEHLLLGVIGDNGDAGQVLRELGLTDQLVREEIELLLKNSYGPILNSIQANTDAIAEIVRNCKTVSYHIDSAAGLQVITCEDVSNLRIIASNVSPERMEIVGLIIDRFLSGEQRQLILPTGINLVIVSEKKPKQAATALEPPQDTPKPRGREFI